MVVLPRPHAPYSHLPQETRLPLVSKLTQCHCAQDSCEKVRVLPMPPTGIIG